MDFHRNFNQFFDGLQLPRQQASRTERLPLLPGIGEGIIHRFVPRSDLEVVVSDYTLHHHRAVPLVNETPMVEVNYCLQGAREVKL
ncbi:hypothetical protein PAESOLCIP111_01267 [Paenibacillus solanacearum]|uniref:Uncharacterized protein n=1 Tax=Paenibacillus solanacearum TaxID=2048548 RepID=A0A916JWE8_9BACL|nr:hypothetical protein PAESOLCIP111_01267 [Paenibacillus solanacearum]